MSSLPLCQSGVEKPRATLRRALPVLVAIYTIFCADLSRAQLAPAPLVLEAPTTERKSGAPQLSELLDIAQRLMKNRLNNEAFELLKKSENELAGSPQFDFALGVSALDSGRPGQAVFALERLLAKEPNNAAARAELARALFTLKELEASKREFTLVNDSNPPNSVRIAINRYLDAIQIATQQQTQSAKLTKLTLDFGVSFDSNVNLGSAQSEWLLADGARLIPTASSLGQSASVAQIVASIEHQARLTAQSTAFFQASVNGKTTFVGPNVTFVTLDSAAGVASTRQSGVWTVSINAGHSQVNATALRNVFGTSVQWQKSITKTEKLGLYLQNFNMSFPNSPSQNARRTVVGATMARENLNGLLLVGLVSYTAESSQTNSPEFSFSAPTLRFIAEQPLGNEWLGTASLSLEDRKYKGVQLLFSGLTRRDREIDLKLSAEKKWSSALSIVPSIAFTSNASSLGPNDFKRHQIALTVKYRN
jgi:outer membrane protein